MREPTQKDKLDLVHISLVSYNSPLSVLLNAIISALRSLQELQRIYPTVSCSITLIDNFESHKLSLNDFSPIQPDLVEAKCRLRLIQGHGNIGYGRGHNLAFGDPPARYHLFMNPDVEIELDCLRTGIEYLEENYDVAIVSPHAVDAIGDKQFLCKRYPSVFDFFARGFMPKTFKRFLMERLFRYEMRELSEYEPTKEISIVSGCFMLCRSETVAAVSGFDPLYFLYFEDFDLSMRVGKIGSIAYLPTMRIRHKGGYAARKGLKHILLFCKSGFRFFHNHGWKWL